MAKEDLINKIETELVDSTTNKITGESVKNVLLAMVDEMGQGGGGGGSSQMEYWALPSGMTELGEMGLLCPIAKFAGSEGVIIATPTYMFVAEVEALAFGLDPSIKYVIDGQVLTAYEIFSEEDLLGWGYVKIEESDFYSF